MGRPLIRSRWMVAPVIANCSVAFASFASFSTSLGQDGKQSRNCLNISKKTLLKICNVPFARRSLPSL